MRDCCASAVARLCEVTYRDLQLQDTCLTLGLVGLAIELGMARRLIADAYKAAERCCCADTDDEVCRPCIRYGSAADVLRDYAEHIKGMP